MTRNGALAIFAVFWCALAQASDTRTLDADALIDSNHVNTWLSQVGGNLSTGGSITATGGFLGTATNATNVATNGTSTNASFYPLFVSSSSNGNQVIDLNSAFTFNPSTSTLTATNFAGTATNASNVATTATSTNASFFPLFVSSSSNSNQAADLHSTFTFNPSTNTVTATTFSGALTGNASTATTATNANNIAVTAVTANTTYHPVFTSGTSGNNAPDVATALTYNASTQVLTATNGTFSTATKSPIFEDTSGTLATNGLVRGANTPTILGGAATDADCWRNSTNNGDICLFVAAGDERLPDNNLHMNSGVSTADLYMFYSVGGASSAAAAGMGTWGIINNSLTNQNPGTLGGFINMAYQDKIAWQNHNGSGVDTLTNDSGDNIDFSGGIVTVATITSGDAVSATSSVSAGTTVSATTSVNAGTDVNAGGAVAAAGDITSTLGNISATAGNITATVGTVTAAAALFSGAGVGSYLPSFNSPSILTLDTPNGTPYAIVLRRDDAGPNSDTGIFNSTAGSGQPGCLEIDAGDGSGTPAEVASFCNGQGSALSTQLFGDTLLTGPPGGGGNPLSVLGQDPTDTLVSIQSSAGGGSNFDGYGGWHVQSLNPSGPAMVFLGNSNALNQDFTQWQNGSFAVLANVDYLGNFTMPQNNIIGTADVTQLKVKGNATQTHLIWDFQTSDGSTVFNGFYLGAGNIAAAVKGQLQVTGVQDQNELEVDGVDGQTNPIVAAANSNTGNGLYVDGDGTVRAQSANMVMDAAGFGLQVKEGTNAKQGVATLVAGTITVSNTSVTANSRIALTCQDPNGGVPGVEYISTRTAGTSFVITSSAADTCIVFYEIFEPSP